MTNAPQPEVWPCPKCSTKGLNSNVKLKQINGNEALYLCEGKDCLYPLEALKRFPIVQREVGAMAVSEKLLETLDLPLSLMETGLTEFIVNRIVELSLLRRQIKKIQETKEAWGSFVERMVAEGEEMPCEFYQYRDADLAKLENIESTLNPYISHICTNSDKKE